MAQQIGTLPVGAKVCDPNTKYYGESIVWDVMEHGHDGTGTTSLVSDRILCIKAFDAKEPSNTNKDRKNLGNNNYKLSNLLQWLNSAAAAGTWYAAQHATDQAPASTSYVTENPYSDEAGFLNGFDPQFRDALLSKAHKTIKNTVTDGGGSEDVTSKIFLLSITEVDTASQNGIAEGSLYALFAQAENRKAKPTPQAVANSTYHESGLNADTFFWYWLRTLNPPSSSNVRLVHATGSLYSSDACTGIHGVRPACVIPSSTLVSSSPDAYGVYTIEFNTVPTSPAGIAVPECIRGGVATTVTWEESTDTDGNFKEYVLERAVDGDTYAEIYRGAERAYTDVVSRGTQTVQYRVCGVDTYGATSEYTTSAIRQVINATDCSVMLHDGLPSGDTVTLAMLSIEGSLPEDADLSVEMTNNFQRDADGAVSDGVVWEDCTADVLAGRTIELGNRAGDARCFNFRIHADAGPSGEGGYISRVLGDFCDSDE